MAEVKLRIYDGKKIEKTYVTQDLAIPFGIIEDILEVIDIDRLNDNNELTRLFFKSLSKLKPMLKAVFDGLTDEEISKAHNDEVMNVFMQILIYTFGQLGAFGSGKM